MTQTTTERLLKRLLTITAFLFLWLMTPSSGWSQATCEPPRRCFSKAEVRATVDAKCLKDRKRAERLDEVTRDLSTADRGWAFCRGQLDEARSQTEQKRLSPAWLRVGLDVTAPLLGASGGACVGVGCPVELSTALVTTTVAVVIARIVLEYLDGR